MLLTPLMDIAWAYQLHYYLCFRTHWRQEAFSSERQVAALQFQLEQICQDHDYRLLENKIYLNQLRCLLSLRPSQTISDVVRTLKANSSREFSRLFDLSSGLWARGFLARSVGRIRVDPIRRYLTSQPEHHGYAFRVLPPVYRYRAGLPVVLNAAHSVFDLNHHLVFATRYRKGVFSSRVGEALCGYWLKVAEKYGFAIDQVSIVPDHTHLLVRNVPKLSVEECALALLNNGQHFIGQNFPNLLVEVGLDQLWQASAYAGTCGELTTALLKKWLSS